MSRQQERALDKALAGKQTTDTELAPLVQAGERIRSAFDVSVPTARAERAMFVQAVGARRHPLGWMRVLAPISVTAAAAIVVLLLGRSAMPGQTFYPVREVLRSVGLAPASLEEIDGWLEQAATLLARAETTYDANETQAERLAIEAVKLLGAAEELVDEVDSREPSRREDRIQALLVRAEALLTTGPVGPEADDEGKDGDDQVVGRRDDEEDDEGPDEDDEGDDEGGDDGSRAGSDEGANHDSRADDGGGDNDGDDRSGSNSGPGGDGSGGDDDTNDGDDGDDGDDTNDQLGDDEENDEFDD